MMWASADPPLEIGIVRDDAIVKYPDESKTAKTSAKE